MPSGIGPRYLQHLVSHWSHKMAATREDETAYFPFSNTDSATMRPVSNGVDIIFVSRIAGI